MADNQRQQNVVLTADTSGYEKSMDAAAKSTESVLSSVTKLSIALGELTKRTGQKIELVGVGTAAALAAATMQAAKFQQQMSTLQANAVMTGRSFDTMVRQTNSLRSSMGLSTDTVIQLVQQLQKLGQGGSGIEKMAGSFVKLGAVTGESIPALVDGLISLQRQMGTQGVQATEKYASSLAGLASSAGTSATGILQFANAIAPIGRMAGMTQTQVMGVSTAFTKAGADGFAASNTFNKMLTDITKSIQYGSPEIAAYANIIGKTREEFTKMSKTEAITQIFEEINKQGPNAIKTLENLGIEGLRGLKSIQAVSQAGGIRKTVAEAMTGYKDTDKFNRAAEEAMGGLNESFEKLKNTLSQLAEAFGQGLLGPLGKAVDLVNVLLSPLAQLLQSLGNIPGLATAAGAALLGMTGFGIANIGKIMLGAAGVQAIRGFPAAGFAAGRASDPSKMSPWATRAAESYSAGRGGFWQRMGYGLGNLAGTATRGAGELGSEMMEGRRPLSQRLRSGANLVSRGIGDFFLGQLEPAQPQNVHDPFNRRPMFSRLSYQDWRSRQQEEFKAARGNVFQTAAPPGMAGTWTPSDPFRTKLGNMENSAGWKASTEAMAENAREQRRHTGVLKTAASQVFEFGKAAAGAAVGGIEVGGSLVAEQARRRGPNLGRRMLSGLKDMAMDNAPMLAIGGVMAGVSYASYLNEDRKKQTQEAKDATDAVTMGGEYRVALGEAAKATTTFADVVMTNSQRMAKTAEFTGKISDDMVAEYNKDPSRKFTAASVENMSQGQLEAYAGLQGPGMTSQDRELFGYDLLKKTQGNKIESQRIMDLTSGGTGTDLKKIFAAMEGRDWAGFGGMSERSVGAMQAGTSILGENYSNLMSRGDVQGANKLQTLSFNAAVASRFGNKSYNVEQGAAALSTQLGGTDEFDTGAIADIINRGLTPAGGRALLEKRIKSGDARDVEKRMWAAIQGSGLTGSALNSTTWTPPDYANEQFADIDRAQFSRQTSVGLGRSLLTRDTAMGRQIETAIRPESTSREDIQYKTVQMMASEAIKLQGGTTGAIAGLQKMQSAAESATSPMYQLAKATEAQVRHQQDLDMRTQTQGQQMGVLRERLATTQETMRVNPNTPGITDQLKQDTAAVEQAQGGIFERVKAISLSYRALQQQQAYALVDYNKQVDRANTQQALQESRTLADYNTQREQQQQQFDLSRQRGYADFARNREREEASYYRNLKRSERDYQQGRKYAQMDYEKGRRRAEEDFNHQVVLMTKATAKTVYDIYNRVTVQRTWDAQNMLQNLADQERRMQEQQANLAKVRGMGLSGDVIATLGLNDPANADQLARMVQDLMEDPKLVGQFNASIAQRIKSAGKIVTDEDNAAWEEMNASFNKNMEHGWEDFNESLGRQEKAFRLQQSDAREERNIALAAQVEDFNRQMAQSLADYQTMRTQNNNAFWLGIGRNRTDFKTSMGLMEADYQAQITRANEMWRDSTLDLTDKIGTLSEEAAKALRGASAEQFNGMIAELKIANGKIQTEVNNINTSLGLLQPTAANYMTSGSTMYNEYKQDKASGGTSRVTSPGASITSGFGPRGNGFHYGVDLGVGTGSPVYAYKAGKIISTSYQANGFGNHVRMDHGGGLYTIYGHLSGYRVGSGATVGAGQLIGLSGSSGNSTGPHLHYEVRKGSSSGNNNAVNPMPYLIRSGGGGVYGNKLGDRIPVMAEAGEYVIPKFRARELGWGFFDQLKANGIAGIKNHLVQQQGVPNTVATQNYYSRIDKSTNFTGDITVKAQDPRELVRKLEAEKRMKALTGR